MPAFGAGDASSNLAGATLFFYFYCIDVEVQWHNYEHARYYHFSQCTNLSISTLGGLLHDLRALPMAMMATGRT